MSAAGLIPAARDLIISLAGRYDTLQDKYLIRYLAQIQDGLVHMYVYFRKLLIRKSIDHEF